MKCRLILLLVQFFLAVSVADPAKQKLFEDFDPCIGKYLFDMKLSCSLGLDYWWYRITAIDENVFSDNAVIGGPVETFCITTPCNVQINLDADSSFFEWKEVEIIYDVTHNCTKTGEFLRQTYATMDIRKCKDPAKKIDKTVNIDLNTWQLGTVDSSHMTWS